MTHRWPYPKTMRCATSVLCQYSSGLKDVRTKSAPRGGRPPPAPRSRASPPALQHLSLFVALLTRTRGGQMIPLVKTLCYYKM